MSLRYEYSNYSKLAFDVNIFQAKMQCIDLSFSNVKTSEPIYIWLERGIVLFITPQEHGESQ